MLLRTTGHATLSLEPEAGGDPLLITDPWLVGSCYWRSWWLERYPSPEQIAHLARTRFVYLTHEHPDHFHPPSLRALGTKPQILVPEVTHDRMGAYLRERAFPVTTLDAGTPFELGQGVRVLSMPTVGNDSALLLDTPRAFVANMNDARPSPDQMLALRAVRRTLGRGKPCIVLAGYSAGGIGHSMYKGRRQLDFAGEGRHLDYVALLCRVLDAQTYVAFASQVRFERPDTVWANAHHVSVAAVFERLSSKVQVLPPHVTLDLETGEHTTEHGSEPRREARIAERVDAQLALERGTQLQDADCEVLARKLRSAGNAWLPALFPRGIGFDLDGQQLHYNAFTGRVTRGPSGSSMLLRLPARPLQDVLHTGFFSDLCIPMFTQVELAPETPPHFVYAFFLLMQLHDVGVTTSYREAARWLVSLARERLRLAQHLASGQARRMAVPSFAGLDAG